MLLMAKRHIRATRPATGHSSPAEAQTGKCPTSGDFFAIFRAVMGCFCPKTASTDTIPECADSSISDGLLWTFRLGEMLS